MSGVSLFVMMLNAPLIAVLPDDLSVLHAATMKTIPTSEHAESVDAACGAEGLKLMHTEANPLWLWPPQHALPTPYVRCRECWVVTGKKRPRVKISAS